MDASVAVFGAYGHTGRFVVAELRKRGYEPLLIGRDLDRLRAMGQGEARRATVGDPASLDLALAGAAAVINCAGPFAETAGPLVEAALRAGVPYVDVAAEIEANADMFALFAERAREAGVPVVPAMAFYGGLGDLLVTAAMGEWIAADEVHVAYGLSSWHPTAGTLASGTVSGQRRGGRRVRFTGGELRYHDDALPSLEWAFPGALGTQPVIGEFTMADVVTVPSHLDVPEVRTYMTAVAAADLAAATAAPVAVDDHGRSAQTFVVDVVVRSGGEERRMSAAGRDIYAITAPLAVEAVARLLTGRSKAVGVVSAGAAFDARDFLDALADHLTIQVPAERSGR
ncbi:saccharopine dehydrogenase NADP-binding domain-containing protein [Actinoplanes hulinensis]|uniref:Saccharopine dehydrogenase NADP-binding domain-containing protein n=2 Tax=Actinoplanes hulinensis TaxID=1144547 RepID=A0ABS7B9E5_9ACTN|nr:saccharopine dehydrogenase NADP-binding domain-containing protein [Actinoplanes hulinensis]